MIEGATATDALSRAVRRLAPIMVREGMAWAFVRYSGDYVDEEARAKADQLGIDTRRCAPPWGSGEDNVANKPNESHAQVLPQA